MADAEKTLSSEGNEADGEDTDHESEKEKDDSHVDVHDNKISRNNDVYLNTSLSEDVKRKVRALKKVQLEWAKLEAQFFTEVHKLECEYEMLHEPLYEKRNLIVTGKIVPNDEDCHFQSDVETDDEDEVKKKLNLDDPEEKDKIEGIPIFWLTVFKNCELTSDMVQPHDEPILKYLSDVKVKMRESNPMGYVLEFYFDPNDSFSNAVLTKEYEMNSTVDETDPFTFDGPEIVKCKGCTIAWNPGKDVTKTNRKHKLKAASDTTEEIHKRDSFFNFFDPPIPNETEMKERHLNELLAADFEIGHFMRTHLVPRAVLFYTGEAVLDNIEESDLFEEDDDLDEEPIDQNF